MSRTRKGTKGPGYEYWTARPGNKFGGTISVHGGKHTKKSTHKAERQEGRQQSKEQE